jgi:YidC/Oxa1 family membrane protein insertase
MGFITDIFQNLLNFLVTTTGSLGFAIITFTFLIRSALLPITIPSLKSTKKMQKLQPEIKKLQKKHGKDKQALQQAQMELYKSHNVNPLAGCIPQLAQLAVLILLYRTLLTFLNDPNLTISTEFFWLNLSVPDTKYILPVLAMITQFFLSLMIAPGAEKRDIIPNNSKSKKVQKANDKEEDMAGMAQSMQQQMMFVMPLMTGFIALRFPSGLALYWVATTLFSIGQQWYVSGPGGLVTYTQRAKLFINSKLGK